MEKQVHQIKCESCGSKIDPSKMFCEYCGTKLYVEQKKQTAPDVVTAEQRFEFMMENASHNNVPVVAIILFMIIWVTIAFFGAISLFSFGSFMGVVPALMGVFGVVIMISQIKSACKIKNEIKKRNSKQ